MKKLLISVSVICAMAMFLYAAETNKISRLTAGILNVGGTTTTNGKTVVVSGSTTNEYRAVAFKATVATTGAAYTNTFANAFLATPVVLQGVSYGASAAGTAPTVLTRTVSLDKFIITGMTAGTDIEFMAFGYTRTGVFE